MAPGGDEKGGDEEGGDEQEERGRQYDGVGTQVAAARKSRWLKRAAASLCTAIIVASNGVEELRVPQTFGRQYHFHGYLTHHGYR